MQKATLIIFIILTGAIIIIFGPRIFNNPLPLPYDHASSTTETITLQDGIIIEANDESAENIENLESMKNLKQKETPIVITKEVTVTDGTRHTIPLNEVLQGCPGRDCIPSIDNPEFETIASAVDWLEDDAPGIAFTRGNVSRFYPYDILISHELVNDTIDGERVLISYCPLCLTAIVFDPLVNGERVEFGVSGLLWKSNLIMYDRATETMWSQVLGEAVIGELAGTRLPILSSDQMLFGNWKQANTNGEVLSSRFGRGKGNPYADTHFDISNTALHFAQPTDDRLPFGAQVFGITVNGKAKAYHIDAVKAAGVVSDTFEGKTFELTYDNELDITRIFEVRETGEKIRINPVSGFWFSWAEARPDTKLFK